MTRPTLATRCEQLGTRIRGSLYLIDLAIARTRELAHEVQRVADGFAPSTTCDVCGEIGKEWPDCRDEYLCERCHRDICEPELCRCGGKKDATESECANCAMLE